MALCRTRSAAVFGIDAHFIDVAVDMYPGGTPIKGLYLCGSGAHPAGGIMGAPAHNAAREILKVR